MDRRVKTVISLINANAHRETVFDDASTLVNLSLSRLRHIFKEETGVSPVQYLRQLRMQKAKELLETTYLNIKQIMIQVGVNDESHFVRDFKKVFGLTPTQCRDQFHNSSRDH